MITNELDFLEGIADKDCSTNNIEHSIKKEKEPINNDGNGDEGGVKADYVEEEHDMNAILTDNNLGIKQSTGGLGGDDEGEPKTEKETIIEQLQHFESITGKKIKYSSQWGVERLKHTLECEIKELEKECGMDFEGSIKPIFLLLCDMVEFGTTKMSSFDASGFSSDMAEIYDKELKPIIKLILVKRFQGSSNLDILNEYPELILLIIISKSYFRCIMTNKKHVQINDIKETTRIEILESESETSCMGGEEDVQAAKKPSGLFPF